MIGNRLWRHFFKRRGLILSGPAAFCVLILPKTLIISESSISILGASLMAVSRDSLSFVCSAVKSLSSKRA